MKSLKRQFKDFIDYFGVPKEHRLDTHLQNIIASHTGFKADDIELNVAKKLNMKVINEFDYFEFVYHKKEYKLIRGKLEEVV